MVSGLGKRCVIGVYCLLIKRKKKRKRKEFLFLEKLSPYG
jgi:hypothetical protein